MTGIAPVRVEFVGSSDPIIQELSKLNAGLGNTQQRIGTTDRAFNTFSRGGMRKVENGVANLALGMVGLQGPIGKVTEGLILMGAGTGPLLLLAAAVTALSVAYNFLTRRSREQKKAHDDLIQGYIKAHGATQEMIRADAQLEAATLRLKVAHIEELRNLDFIGRAILGLTGKKKLLADLDKALAQDAADQAKKNRKTRLDDELLGAKSQNDTLEALNKQLFAEDLISRQQYFDQRIKLAQNATQAEVADLTGQLRDAHGEERKHLERMIELRTKEGERQIMAIQFEQQLLEVEEKRTILAEQRRIRIEQAGGGNKTQGMGGAALLPSGTPAILQGAIAQGFSQGDALTKRLEEDRAAAEALAQTLRGSLASAIADFFTNGLNRLGSSNPDQKRIDELSAQQQVVADERARLERLAADGDEAAAKRVAQLTEEYGRLSGQIREAAADTYDLGNAFADFARSIAQSIQQLVAQLIALKVVQGIFGASIGGGGGFGNLTQSGGHAAGGYISGPGSGISDSIPARLSNGEFVVNARSTAQNFPLLEAINAQPFRMQSYRTPHFASGGFVMAEGGASSLTATIHATHDPGVILKVVNSNFPVLVQNHRKNIRDSTQ